MLGNPSGINPDLQSNRVTLGRVFKHPSLRPYAGWRAGLRTGRGRRPVQKPGRYGDRLSRYFTLQRV